MVSFSYPTSTFECDHFSLSTFAWHPGIKLRSPICHRKHLFSASSPATRLLEVQLTESIAENMSLLNACALPGLDAEVDYHSRCALPLHTPNDQTNYLSQLALSKELPSLQRYHRVLRILEDREGLTPSHPQTFYNY